jgi:phosphoribosylaminoimidazole (AIR) synthetase
MIYSELGKTLGEELLTPHRCYRNQLKSYLREIHGIAHITGEVWWAISPAFCRRMFCQAGQVVVDGAGHI